VAGAALLIPRGGDDPPPPVVGPGVSSLPASGPRNAPPSATSNPAPVSAEDADRIAGIVTGPPATPTNTPERQPESTPANRTAPDRRAVEPETPPVKPTPDPPPERRTGSSFDEGAARREIRALVERQRRATEAADLRALLADVHPDLREEASFDMQAMMATADQVRSEVSDIQIEFEDTEVAYVAFAVRLTGRLLATGERVLIADTMASWTLLNESGRWLIWEW
ncbi:MAG: nuclear transport factor 2 family protein, partial [Gemmatimonadetes bacterium]|nr:nuclear transport factor 2 family protein [Gemmatimonadota bacterium]